MAHFYEYFLKGLYIITTFVLVVLYLYYKLIVARYWRNLNVPYEEPFLLLGNIWGSAITNNSGIYIANLQRKWKHTKLVGIWNFWNPILVVTDLSVIKSILFRDFLHFQARGSYTYTEREPFAGNLLNLRGHKWRNLRTKLSPVFTSGKIKMMFPIMAEVGEELRDTLRIASRTQKVIDAKDITSRYTLDVIGSCCFGIKTNSLKNSKDEFWTYALMFIKPRLLIFIVSLIIRTFPKLKNLFKFNDLPENVTEFFASTIRDTMRYREENKIRKNDFIDLFMQLMKRGRLCSLNEGKRTGEESNIDDAKKLTFDEVVAQALSFFVAGFETSATTMTFCLYELALHNVIQSTLQTEIDKLLLKCNGKLTYEGINELEYLDKVIQETLRKYPPATIIFRECTHDYVMPQTGTTIPKGTQIFIPVLGIHRDPELYPYPETFDPNRFSQAEKQKRNNFAMLSFGEGPRLCIGNKFALLLTKVGIVSILSKFNVKPTSKTPITIEFKKNSVTLCPKEKVLLEFEARG